MSSTNEASRQKSQQEPTTIPRDQARKFFGGLLLHLVLKNEKIAKPIMQKKQSSKVN